MSITNIAKKVSIARSTVHKIIQHYKINDGMIPGIPEKQQRKKIFTEEIAAVLKDPKLLSNGPTYPWMPDALSSKINTMSRCPAIRWLTTTSS